jgi:CBS domain-containing protein
MTVKKILKLKGTYTPTVHPDALVADVISLLEADDVGALVVSSDDERIEGIISERDVVRGLETFGVDVLGHSVSDLMSVDVVTCTAESPVGGVMALMDEKQIRHVPVVEDGKLAGIVSIRDIIKLRLEEVQNEADAMRAYIAAA